jgi:hypothetical protein
LESGRTGLGDMPGTVGTAPFPFLIPSSLFSSSISPFSLSSSFFSSFTNNQYFQNI